MMYLQVLRTKYDQFGGRAGRREFWLFWLVHFVLLVVAAVADGFAFPDTEWFESGPILAIYGSATFVPVLAIGARRLHDTGRTGWFQLLMAFWLPAFAFGAATASLAVFDGSETEVGVTGTLTLVFLIAALIGTVILIVFAIMPGDESDNQYGMPNESPDRPAVYWTVLTTRYAMFAGRAGRKEFWLYSLVSFLVVAGIAATLDQWLLGDLVADNSTTGPIGLILFLATLIPGLALGARRLHDIGRSGFWQFLHFLLLIGTIVLIVMFIMPSQEGENSHGAPAVAPE